MGSTKKGHRSQLKEGRASPLKLRSQKLTSYVTKIPKGNANANISYTMAEITSAHSLPDDRDEKTVGLIFSNQHNFMKKYYPKEQSHHSVMKIL